MIWSGWKSEENYHVLVNQYSKQYRFFGRNPSVLFPCNPRRTLAGFFWGCMVIVLKGSFKEPILLRVQFQGNFRSETHRKIKSVFRYVIWCFNASWGLKGLTALPILPLLMIICKSVDSLKGEAGGHITSTPLLITWVPCIPWTVAGVSFTFLFSPVLEVVLISCFRYNLLYYIK